MISLSCFACTKGLHRVVESAIDSDSGNFHSSPPVYPGYWTWDINADLAPPRLARK